MYRDHLLFTCDHYYLVDVVCTIAMEAFQNETKNFAEDEDMILRQKRLLIIGFVIVALPGIILNPPVILVSLSRQLKNNYKWLVLMAATCDLLSSCYQLIQIPFVINPNGLLFSKWCNLFLQISYPTNLIQLAITCLLSYHR